MKLYTHKNKKLPISLNSKTLKSKKTKIVTNISKKKKVSKNIKKQVLTFRNKKRSAYLIKDVKTLTIELPKPSKVTLRKKNPYKYLCKFAKKPIEKKIDPFKRKRRYGKRGWRRCLVDCLKFIRFGKT